MLGVIILIGIVFVCVVIIYLVNVMMPRKVQNLEETKGIAGIPSEGNCGACSMKSGCFAYTQALTKDAGEITKQQ